MVLFRVTQKYDPASISHLIYEITIDDVHRTT